MADDSALYKAVQTYLDTEDDFAAEKLKATGEINKRKKEALAKIYTRVGKLDVMKEAFDAAVLLHRHKRDLLGVFPKVEEHDDLDLAGGFARVVLASDDMFQPLYDADLKAHLEVLVEELNAEPSSDENVVRMHEEAA